MTDTQNPNEQNALPIGWKWVKIQDIGAYKKNAIVDGPFGSNLKLSDYIDGEDGVPVLTTKNLVEGKEKDGWRYISYNKYAELKRSEVVGGDILVAKIGSCGKNGFYPKGFPTAIIPANLLKISVHPIFPSKFVYYYLNSPQFKDNLDGIITATAQPAFGVTKFRKLDFPLAPLPEQKRIVAKIEELFTQLDAGVAALKRAQTNLKRYKASVLKAACEGRLVPTEATLHPNDYESAAVLLERILAERRRKWEAEHPGKKYKEPARPDVKNLPELPEGWVWASLNQLSWDSGYGTSQKCDYDASGPAVIRIPNIVNNKIFLQDVKYATKAEELNINLAVSPGDLLIIRTNGSRDLIGRSAVITEEYDDLVYFASYIIRYRLLFANLIRSWINAIWDSILIRVWIEEKAATTAGQYNVSVSKLNNLPIPIPPLEEQKRIVKRVERLLSIIQDQEEEIEKSLKRAECLRQAILKRAFEGRLVPQDPADEPASVLLARVKEEKSDAY